MQKPPAVLGLVNKLIIELLRVGDEHRHVVGKDWGHEFNIYGVNGQLTIVGEARVGPVSGWVMNAWVYTSGNEAVISWPQPTNSSTAMPGTEPPSFTP